MEDTTESKYNFGRRRNVYFIILVILLAAFVGYFSFWVTAYFHDPVEQNRELRLNTNNYTFINPLIGYTEADSGPLLADDIDNLKEEINSATERLKKTGIITQGSVYYRDLNNGPWFIAGDVDVNYKPASLFKVPLMIAYFKVAETDPSILEKEVVYEKAFEKTVSYSVNSSDKTIELGKSYRILELIESMITYSDNLAAYLLLEHIDPDVVVRVFKDLGVQSPTDVTYKEEISPRTYASFFRTLYNATYINHEYSEKALAILSHTSFKHGMRSVIDKDTNASTKFGIGVTDDGLRQLHECGIIYWVESRPILLCIMTMGREFELMSNYIKEVTREVEKATLRQ